MSTVSIVYVNRPTSELLYGSASIVTDHWWVDRCFDNLFDATKYVAQKKDTSRTYKIETYPVQITLKPVIVPGTSSVEAFPEAAGVL